MIVTKLFIFIFVYTILIFIRITIFVFSVRVGKSSQTPTKPTIPHMTLTTLHEHFQLIGNEYEVNFLSIGGGPLRPPLAELTIATKHMYVLTFATLGSILDSQLI